METETLVILDFGSQYTQLIARRARELGVFSFILPFNASIAEINKYNPKGIILSGGPNSVYEPGAPKFNKQLLNLNIPILGICYGLQLVALSFGGKVEKSAVREYGLARLDKKSRSLLLPEKLYNSPVWMSHGDHVLTAPKGFKVTALSEGLICAIENQSAKIFGLQFHPEVSHTRFGEEILRNFIIGICNFSQDWTPASFIPTEIARIRKQIGQNKAICALSGGVDSSVAAALVNKAIGPRQTCIFVDTGLLRKSEYKEVLETYENMGLNIKPIRASDQFLSALKGIKDPERKRKIIGREFIKVFEQAARQIHGAKYLVQGTLYPDVIESVSINGPSVTIKSHHNVGGLPTKMKLELIEPLRELFKDEARLIGEQLSLPDSITGRQPFPGPGLAVRILGEVNKKSLTLLQEADAIVRSEIEEACLNKNLWQFFAVLLPIKTVGVMGDGRTYEQVVVIRAVESTDGMTADWAKLPHELLAKISSRLVSEVRGVNRVVYDITSKPPGTIEWE